MKLNTWLWELTPENEDNTKHQSMNDKVGLISIPIEDNPQMECSDTDKHPPILDNLKSQLNFKGNIRLSNSGNSWNIFRDKLEVKSDLVPLIVETF